LGLDLAEAIMLLHFLPYNVKAKAFHAELRRYFRYDLRGGVMKKGADG